MCSIDWDLTIKALTLIVAAISFLFLLREYSNSLKWKRAEFLAKEYSNFINSVYVQASHQMLDGFEMKIIVNSTTTNFSIDFQNKKISKALLKDDKGNYLSEEESTNIRFCIDKYLFKLGLFYCYVENKLVTAKELEPYLIYWIRLIGSPSISIDNELRVNLINYIKDNNYNSVLGLFRLYDFEL